MRETTQTDKLGRLGEPDKQTKIVRRSNKQIRPFVSVCLVTTLLADSASGCQSFCRDPRMLKMHVSTRECTDVVADRLHTVRVSISTLLTICRAQWSFKSPRWEPVECKRPPGFENQCLRNRPLHDLGLQRPPFVLRLSTFSPDEKAVESSRS